MDEDNIKQIIENDPFLKYVGIKILEIGEGRCKLSMGFRHEVTRSGGIMNGGAISTLADAAGGCAVVTVNGGKNQVTVELDVSFMRPIKTGPVIAEARVTKTGRSMSFADIDVYDGKGVKCATVKGIWYFVDF
ncbi:PaaI family thioesterase [Candidatus Parvarchaeota archaeon]|nr:PaaI family thioesterase [Candidatus Parvarchaeota archaeon]